MTDQQFRRIESLLYRLNEYAARAQQDTAWCIERMKRIDCQAIQARAEHRHDRKLQIDRIAEQRAREAARDKADRNLLKDTFIRSGLWEEMAETIKVVDKVWPKVNAKK